MPNAIEVLTPSGEPPTWKDAVWLNIGVGVVPELSARLFYGDINDDGYYDPPAVHMRAFYDRYRGRYMVEFVGFEGVDVSSADLRTVKVSEVLKLVVAHGIFLKLDRDDPPASIHDWWGGAGEPDIVGSPIEELLKTGGPDDMALNLVAQSYQLARISSQPPAKAVERNLGLSARTAARWIAKAKERGLLANPALPGDEELVDMHAAVQERIDRGEVEGLILEWPGFKVESEDHGEHQTEA